MESFVSATGVRLHVSMPFDDEEGSLKDADGGRTAGLFVKVPSGVRGRTGELDITLSPWKGACVVGVLHALDARLGWSRALCSVAKRRRESRRLGTKN